MHFYPELVNQFYGAVNQVVENYSGLISSTDSVNAGTDHKESNLKEINPDEDDLRDTA